MNIYFTCVLAAFAASFADAPHLAADDTVRDSLVRAGDSLRMEYRFTEARDAYLRAAEAEPDSLRRLELADKVLLAENGMNMSGFVSTPEVVARHRFSLSDFYLFYPLPDRVWAPVPNQLDTLGANPFSRAVYAPEGCGEIYFSAPDTTGVMNIHRTEFRDSLWTIPELLNESMMSSSDEIYPMLSADGKTLYFASSGLYGVGGYDIYVSSWDESRGEWGVPVNMGFPYSSPADDFLFINTDDGRYSVFASNRNCPADSVDVFVIEYDDMPVRKRISDESQLRDLCRLAPDAENGGMRGGSAHGSIPDNPEIRRYMSTVSGVRELRDSLSDCLGRLDSVRAKLSSGLSAEERAEAESMAADLEAMVPSLRDTLDKAMAVLQKIEMEFLFNGVAFDPDKLEAEADREVVGASSGYAFTRMNPREALDLRFEVPEKKFDYSFMVLPEGRFAENNTLPSGLVYQIQIFSLSKKATVRQLNGLSPVFETRTSSGRYIYRVGVFRTYNDVLSKLNAVKKAGFKTAFVVPLKDGQVIKLAAARALEAEEKPVYQIRMTPDGGVLPELALKAVSQAGADGSGHMDIARVEEDGKTIYVAGPFRSLEKAEETAAAVRAAGVPEVSVTKVGKVTSK